MRVILPSDLSHRDRHQLLLGGVAPRPIALVATISAEGTVNLAPFSFFNAFASNPPIVAIGPAIAAKTKLPKDTYLNILATEQCTISIVTYSMVHKTNLTSAPYPAFVNEFDKAGFTPSPSTRIRPPWVAESPYALECILMQNIELRRDIGGNGNLMLLEVVAFHVSDSVWTDGRIDPRKMDAVARMGGAWYTRTRDVFSAQQPQHLPIGIDSLPDNIKRSVILTGNDLAQLAYVAELPDRDPSFPVFHEDFKADHLDVELSNNNPEGALYVAMNNNLLHDENLLHSIAQLFIHAGRIHEAWQTLLLGNR